LIVFDIETGPLRDDELLALLPTFDETPFLVGEFDESSVKLGNMKDPAKIKEKIDAARSAHQEKAANAERAIAEGKEKHWRDFKDRAALNPATGFIICIQYCNTEGGEASIDHAPEADLLVRFWQEFTQQRLSGGRLVGLNILEFDLPFLVFRSWLAGVDVPSGAVERWKHRLNFSDTFIDLRNEYLLGRYWSNCKSDFETLAKVFGTPGKPEGVTGADFARLWQEEPEKAKEYAINDVVQPVIWMDRMQMLGKAPKKPDKQSTSKPKPQPAVVSAAAEPAKKVRRF
jgi:hypothetical protein